MTFKGIGLSTGSLIVNFFFLLDKVERLSCLEDLLLFFPFEEQIPYEGGVTFGSSSLEERPYS